MKSIVIFNNKGGVGKTTLLCNIASYLALKKGKKVLVIDADPQCNATSYMFTLEQLEDIYKRENTLVKVIQPVQKGKGYIQGNFPIEKSNTFGVDVVPGDTKLSLAEDFLSKDWLDGKSGDARGLQTTFVFKDLLLKLEDQYDYIFFDVGPSLGALNRAVLVASDLFIVPMSSDIFSLRAIENISKSMSDWKGQLQRGLSDYCDKEDELFILNNNEVKWNLEFIGYIAQQYTAKTNDGVKRPVNAYEKIIKKIPTVIEKHLVADNSKIEHIKLGEIPNLNSLVPLSQSSNTPIFILKSEHGVVGAHFNKVREYEDIISSIVVKLEENITLL
ncbi:MULTISPECIES: ParA family protein [Myroides]|uniref:ParA family protein n=1 Tax=Myroides TaxID=76831 RepID=UPI0015F85F99|nr:MULTISPECIES: AAA family ATPase [Myroides]MBB1139296.1 AAA family ATPase [Myroides sp. WP-1]MDM1499637.1 AAA family ATPase [Myroides odoratimimus]